MFPNRPLRSLLNNSIYAEFKDKFCLGVPELKSLYFNECHDFYG